MPFLGSTPVDKYQSLAKQTITGDGSTAYTLNRSVTNAYDMEVFINNVRQEPDTSYTASGNTITFTDGFANPELQPDSGNIIYRENRKPISRATDQTEDIKIIVEQ